MTVFCWVQFLLFVEVNVYKTYHLYSIKDPTQLIR